MANQPTAEVIELAIVRTMKQHITYLERQLDAAHQVSGHLIAEIEELKAKAAEGATVLPMTRKVSGARA
jgi:hypothetical protein